MSFGANTILIVEDDTPTSEALRITFTRAGFEVVQCCDVSDATSHLQEGSFAAIVLDLKLEHSDGFSLLSQKGQTPSARTPTFVLTNLASDSDRNRAIALGATAFLAKLDVTARDLLEMVRKTIERHDASNS